VRQILSENSSVSDFVKHTLCDRSRRISLGDSDEPSFCLRIEFSLYDNDEPFSREEGELSLYDSDETF
jgi:hypothetical protein